MPTNAGIPVLAAIPANEDIRRKSASYEIIGRPDGEWGPLFAELAKNVAEAPPMRPKPQTQDQLLGLFSADVVGRNVVLEPATVFDMVRQARRHQAFAGSRLRRGLIRADTISTGHGHDTHHSDSPQHRCPQPCDGLQGDGMGCHAGTDAMVAAAKEAGKSEVLEQYARDYPRQPDAGPHDQPQSMCPAFGSLRVGLRMKRTATILSGSACCVYGLDVHIAFLRRPPQRGLCALQLRVAGHGQAV